MEVRTTARKAVALLLTATIAVSASAQIKLKPNGMAVIGSEPAGAAADSVSTLKIYGKSGSQGGGIVSFGNGSLSTPDVLVGEYDNSGSGKLWLHGKYGLQYTSLDGYDVFGYYYEEPNSHNFNFNCNVTVNGRLLSTRPVDDGIRDPIIINPLDILSDIAPEETASATLYIYDMQDTQTRRYAIEGRGEGAVTVPASSLKAGMYIYTLVADGKEIDTKRMILTR